MNEAASRKCLFVAKGIIQKALAFWTWVLQDESYSDLVGWVVPALFQIRGFAAGLQAISTRVDPPLLEVEAHETFDGGLHGFDGNESDEILRAIRLDLRCRRSRRDGVRFPSEFFLIETLKSGMFIIALGILSGSGYGVRPRGIVQDLQSFGLGPFFGGLAEKGLIGGQWNRAYNESKAEDAQSRNSRKSRDGERSETHRELSLRALSA